MPPYWMRDAEFLRGSAIRASNNVFILYDVLNVLLCLFLPIRVKTNVRFQIKFYNQIVDVPE